MITFNSDISSKIIGAWEKARVSTSNDSLSSKRATLGASCLWEYVPKPEGFVTCSCDNGASIWVHCQVENSECVPSQSGNFLHRWVFPHNHLVQRVAMGAHKFIIGFGEDQVANLTTCVDTV